MTATGATAMITGGSQYTVVTLDVDARGVTGVFSSPTGVSVDGADLPAAADVTTCAAPGCWRFDAATKHLEARVHAPTGQTRALTVH